MAIALAMTIDDPFEKLEWSDIIGPVRGIRKASLLAQWRKRDSIEHCLLKTVSLGGAWQQVSKVRSPH